MLRAKFTRDGSVGDAVNLTTFGILALRAAAVTVPARTDEWLLAQQDHDGGFGFAQRGGASDVDDTGAALEALASLPGARAAAVRARAIAYVRRQQDHDGGFPSQPGEGSNAQSTAWAVQGLDAAGVNPAGVRHAGGPSPLAYLQSLIGRDGAVAYAAGQTQTPVWVTGEALMALAGKPLPLAPLPAPAAKPAPTPKAPATTAPTSTARPRTASTSTASTSTAARSRRRPRARRGDAGRHGRVGHGGTGPASVARPDRRFPGAGARGRRSGRDGGDRGGRRDRDANPRCIARAHVTPATVASRPTRYAPPPHEDRRPEGNGCG